MEGFGIYTWPDGRRYEGTEMRPQSLGNYMKGKKHGHGKLLAPDGHTFEGQWNNGVQHGVGKCETGTEVKFGVWNSGKVERWLDPRLPTDRQLLETTLGAHFEPPSFGDAILGAGSSRAHKLVGAGVGDKKESGESLKQQKAREKEEEMLCKVCYQQKNGVALIPCGHLFCKDCAKTLTKCPLDTKPIEKRVTIYY